MEWLLYSGINAFNFLKYFFAENKLGEASDLPATLDLLLEILFLNMGKKYVVAVGLSKDHIRS